jgi:RNA polymerase sigma-70 factor (ECF subfamily)
MMAVARGDLSAFDEIVHRHEKLAWSIAYRFIGDLHQAEDIAQEAFLKILDAADRYKPAAAFTTYLTRIVTRLCIDYVKKKHPIPSENLPPFPDLSGSEQMRTQDRERVIRKALDMLPPGQRMAVVLRYFERFDHRKIAAAMEITIKAVERLLARARNTLKPLLSDVFEE